MDDHRQADDVDRLFARLTAPAAPACIIEQAMAQAAAREVHRRIAIAVSGYAALLAAITALAFAFGRDLTTGGAGRIVTLALLEPAAVIGAPKDFFWAILERLPWPWLAALLVAFAILAWSVRSVAAIIAALPPRDQKGKVLHA